MSRLAGPLVLALLATACTSQAPQTDPTGTSRSAPITSPATEPPPSANATARPTATTTPAPSAASPASGTAWEEAGRFPGAGLAMPVDIAAWERGFIAVGQGWPQDNIGNGTPTLHVWTSADGRSWQQAEPDLGTDDLDPNALLPTPDGSVVMLATVGRGAAAQGLGTPRAAAWISSDGIAWDEVDLPFGDDVTSGLAVGSGPIGHVAATTTELWHSPDGVTWQRTHQAPAGVQLRQPVGGDEGFVVTAIRDDGTDQELLVVASGDGLTWFESSSDPQPLAVAPWRGDWLGSAYLDDPPTIGILRSTDGLEWSAGLDVNDLTPPDGPKAGKGMESEITETSLAGEGGVMALTLGWNHCCAVPAIGVDVFTSTDAESWTDAGLPDGAYVTALATDGEVAVLAGYVDRGQTAVFWTADR